MYKYLSATALVCLFATSPAFAQNSTATGVGIANSESNSAAGAIAVNRGNGNSSSSLTVNNPANTTSTVNTNLSGTTTSNVNQNLSGTTTSNVNSKVSGSTRTEVVSSGTQTIKNVPAVVAPGLTAAGLETCLGSASGTVSAVGFGIGGGSTYRDEDCTARLDSRTLFAMGLKSASVARLCQRPDIWRSMPDICQKYWPVGVPLPQGIAVVTSGVTPVVGPAPLIAPRPIIYDPDAGVPYNMGGTSMEVIDGKTGLTRPCSDYNAVRQKCLNWADTKLAAAKPKPKKPAVVVTAVKPAPATAAGNPVTASAATLKKED